MDTIAVNVDLARAGVEVALLDLDGVLVDVNDAWTAFTVANGGDPERTGAGVSYFGVCDAAGDDEVSRALAAGVRAAIRGELPGPMRIRISCDRPDERRLFDVLVSSRTGSSGERLGATLALSPTAAADSGSPEPAPSGESQRGSPDESPGLSFPDQPRLELDELLGQLTGQAQSVLRTQGRLRALLRANAVVASDLSLPVVLRHIVDAAHELVGAQYAALGVVGADGTLIDLVHAGIAPDLPASHPPVFGCLEIPIRVRDQVLGVISLTHGAGGEFSDEDKQLVIALAGSAAVAIENARLFTEAAQQRQWLKASTEMTQELFAGVAGDPFDLVLRFAARGAAADFARVVVPHDEGRGRVQAQMGSIDDHRPGDVVDLVSIAEGRIILTAAPLVMSEHERDATRPAQRPDVPDGVGALAGVPLLDSHGSVLGALLVAREPWATAFTAHDLSLLENFAEHASIAIALDLARSDRETLLLMADHDRIAADLHDHVIQQLFATGMGLHGLVPHQGRPDHQKRLLGYVEALDNTIRRIRTTIFQLEHRHPRTESLRERLVNVLDDERPALGFSVRIDFSGRVDRDVPADLADEVVAVLREALSNVARHAHATSASVRVALAGPVLEVVVSDDGVGLGNASRSSGLSNLRRRAEAHGGTFEVVSPEHGGTHLRWTALVALASG